MPPNIVWNTEEEAYKVAEILRSTSFLTAAWCQSLANMSKPRLTEGLRDEGLDGGSRWTQLLHGGDAAKTAKLIVAPLYVMQHEFENIARSAIVLGSNMRTMYYDPIRMAREARARGGNALPVN